MTMLVAITLAGSLGVADQRTSPNPTPVISPVASTAGLPFTIGEPVNLGSSINGSGFDGGPSIGADRTELYFVSDRPGGRGCGDIWVATRTTTDGPFAQPDNVGPVVNSPACEGAPSVSNDDRSLYLECFEPVPTVQCHEPDFGDDIWVAERADPASGFESLRNLGRGVNGEHVDSFPNVSADGEVLYFSSDRPGGVGDSDLWQVSRDGTTDAFASPENLGDEVNGPGYDGEPAVSSDGLLLLFASDRPGGVGGQDLWLATRPTIDEPFSNPVNLGPGINTPGFEGRPALDGDSTVILFMSDRPGGAGMIDIWQAPLQR